MFTGKYRPGHNDNLRVFYTDSSHQRRALAAAIEKDPMHQSKAALMSDGRRTIKIAKAAADRFFEEHPDVKREVCKKGSMARLRENPNLMSELSQKGLAVQMQRDGQIGLAKIVYHEGHIHRGFSEDKFCKQKVWPKYEHNLVHCNVPFHRHGLDFVIAISSDTWDPNNPDTWARIIEPHQVRYWMLGNSETSESYIKERTSFIRSHNVKCPIEFVVHDKSGTTTCTDIFETLHLVITP